jgi:phenylalanyl-tRNA synthetase beta chain
MEENGKIMSIPPVINSEHTRLTEKTKDLFIDVTGTSLEAITQSINVIASNLAEGGGEIYSVKVISTWEDQFMKEKSLRINPERIVDVLGLRLNGEEIGHLLAKDRMDFDISTNELIIPPFRVDIFRDEDVAEEVAMMYGYSKIEPSKFTSHEMGKYDTITLLEKTVRDLCVGAGFLEVFTYVLANKKNLDGDYVEISNPITDEFNSIRNSMIPVSIDLMSRNQHSRFPIRIFESADVVVRDEESDTGYMNERRLIMAIMDSKVGYEDIQAPLHQILMNLGHTPSYRRKESPYLIKGRSASVIIGNTEIGVLGEVTPETLERFEVQYPVAIAEISLSKLIKIP